jgi:hypothetical protein
MAWNSHIDKLAWARGFLELLIAPTVPAAAEAVSRLAESTHADHVRKMRGLQGRNSIGPRNGPKPIRGVRKTLVSGAPLRNRTVDLLLTMETLCRLS